MAFWKDFGLGFNTYGKAISLIFKKGLWWFFFFPIVVNILLFWGGLEGIGVLIDWFNAKVLGWTSLESADFWGSGVLSYILTFLIGGILRFLFFAFFTFIGGYIVLIIMSPILAYLSEKTEKIITGNDYPFSASQLMRDVVRGVLIAIRNMTIELGWMLIFLIIGIIPLIGWIISLFSPVLMFFISSYFYGFSFMDYSIERQKLNVRKSVHLIRKRKGVAIANGMIFSIFLIIPFCGVSLAGFTAIISTVAASIAMTEIVKQEQINVIVKT